MNQIRCCDWARWHYILPAWDYALCPARKICSSSHIIRPLLTKLVRSRGLDVALARFLCLFFCVKELGQYPAIVISHTWVNPYVRMVSGQLASWTIRPRQLAPRSFIHCGAIRAAKYMNPRLNVIQIILRSFIHYRVWRSGASCLGRIVHGASCPDTHFSNGPSMRSN